MLDSLQAVTFTNIFSRGSEPAFPSLLRRHEGQLEAMHATCELETEYMTKRIRETDETLNMHKGNPSPLFINLLFHYKSTYRLQLRPHFHLTYFNVNVSSESVQQPLRCNIRV